MIEYDEEDLFPFPRDQVWRLLQAHLDDGSISKIHPLVRGQKTLAQNGASTVVQRTIDVLGKPRVSQWRITLNAPDASKFEILTSEGPWAEGSTVENRYADAPGGTRIQSHVRVQVKGIPFFLPQKGTARRVFATIDKEDRAYLMGSP
jgi:hypothetical protein